jgi:HEAT repeat protein
MQGMSGALAQSAPLEGTEHAVGAAIAESAPAPSQISSESGRAVYGDSPGATTQADLWSQYQAVVVAHGGVPWYRAVAVLKHDHVSEKTALAAAVMNQSGDAPRADAIAILGLLGGRDAVRHVLAAFFNPAYAPNPTSPERRALTKAVIHLEGWVRPEDLSGALKDSDSRVRELALQAIPMPHLDEPRLAGLMREALNSPYSDVRLGGLVLVGRIKPPSIKQNDVVPFLTDADPVMRAKAYLAVLTFPPTVTAALLLKGASDQSPAVRSEVAVASSQLALPEALPILDELLLDKDAGVRCAAVQWLGCAAIAQGLQRDAMADLMRATRDPEAVVRLAAARQLMSIDAPGAADAGMQLYLDADSGVKSALVRAVAHEARSPNMALLLAAAQDPDVQVRRSVADVISEIPVAYASPLDAALRYDHDQFVRSAAIAWLSRVHQ